jgi:photosystem II stability/assembly factor-like uncharacterized protein
MKQPTQSPPTGTTNGQPFYEDMRRKARWFAEIRGTRDFAALDRLRDRAVAHVEVMRAARLTRLDPGGGRIAKQNALVGIRRGVKISVVERPGHVREGFITDAVEVASSKADLAATLKQKLRRRGHSHLDPRTARMFRYDNERENWALVDASGWNAKDKYVWGKVDRPGIYAAVALPKRREELRRVALEALARRMVNRGVTSGYFARTSDFADRAMFRDYFVESNRLDEGSKSARAEIDLALKAQRQIVRELGRSWEREPLGGNPQWLVLEEIMFRLDDVRRAIKLDVIAPYRPIFARVANRVGPWFPLGPNNINGRVKSLAMHPTNSDILFAGAANGGVWRSTNGGGSWSTRWKFEDSLAIGAVATAPSNGNVIYAGTGEDTPGYGPSYGGVGLFKSTDGGANWSRITTAAEIGSHCNKILVHPSNSRRVFIATDTGVHRAVLGPGIVGGAIGGFGAGRVVGGLGEVTWERVLPGRATDLVMQHDHPNLLLAGIHNDGLYKSVDGGDHWTRLEGERVLVFAIIIAFKENFPTGADAGWIKLAIGRSGEAGSNFVIVKLGKNSATTLISTDAGENWLKTPGSAGVDYDEWCSLVAVHPRQTRHIYLASVGMQHSFDAWNYTNSPGTHSDHHQMVFHRTNDGIAFVCCDGGVYRTADDGASWHLRSDYLSAAQLMSLGVSQSGDLVIGSATQDQGIIQTDGSSTWVDHGGGNEWGMFVVDPNDSRNIFISPGDGQIRRSTDRGVSYTNPTSGLTDWWAAQNRNTKAASFAHAAVKPGNSAIVVGAATVSDEVKDAAGNVTATYAARHRIYHSTNGGVDWNNVFTLPHRGSRLCFAPSYPTRVYLATSEGRVYRSSNSGASGWSEPATVANRPRNGYITAIHVDPFNKDRVYITYGSGNPHIYRSTDGGATWARCNGTDPAMTLPDIALLDIVVDTENPDVLYVGSDIGVFRSNDRGATWYWANDSFEENDLPRVPVTGLAIHPGTHRLYASTMGRGLYYTQATGIVSLRATHVRLQHEWPRPEGVVRLRLTDGSKTYVMTRLEVIRRIQAGTEVFTVAPDGTRARVRALQPDAQHPREYLSSSPDATTGNNLLTLPRFYS